MILNSQSQDGGQAPGVVDLVHVDTEWKHRVIRLDINEVISSTRLTRLRTGRGRMSSRMTPSCRVSPSLGPSSC